MDWSAPAYVLSFRAFGERDAVVSVMTQDHGRFAGLVRGGQSQKHSTHWQPGHLVNATWRARLSEHLGSFTGEAIKNNSANLMHSPLGLATLLSACALVDLTTPERMPLTGLFQCISDLLPLDEGADDLARYVRFENEVLCALGYGLDFSGCAITGTRDDLAYVSPKTGRAVNRTAAAPWADKLLPLPEFMHKALIPSWDDVAAGLALTGHFIERHVYHHLPHFALAQLAAKRERVLDLVDKQRMVSPEPHLAVS
ncbi:MAG: DNA repair protein RecO [Alphaproteobacteria bacterium]|nr:DNA repair protein RecO [Alphaproteobacteria bacterium]